MKKKLFVFLGIVLAAVILAGCGKKEFKVTFNVDGGTPQVAAQTVEEGKLAKVPDPQPTKDGFTFEGWFLDNEEWDFATEKVTKAITLKAKWAPVAVVDKVTITFDVAGGQTMAPVEIDKGAKLTEPADPQRAGYVFVEWQLDEVAFDFDTAINENITLVAVWSQVAVDYQVIFDARGGTPVPEQTVVEGGLVVKPTDPERQGYNFNGWYLDGVLYDFNSVVESNMRLVAQWTQKVMFNITFVANGGEPAPSVTQIESGHLVAEPAEMTRDKHIFLGWFLGEEEYDFDTPVTSNLILVANWERVYADLTVSFDIGYEEGENPDDQIVREELVAEAPSVSRVGYRFMGWFKEDATEAFVFTTPITEDLHLIAKWHREYQVTFDVGYPEGQSPSPLLVLEGDATPTVADPVREFYQFDGWYEEDATEPFDFEELLNGDVDLVARWTQLDTYTIEYKNVNETMFVYGTQEALFLGYLTDFYEYLQPSMSLELFLYGPGNGPENGYTLGLWIDNTASIYNATALGTQKPENYNPAYFMTHENYMDKWMPFYETIRAFMLKVNPTQDLWKDSWSGLIRLEQFINGRRPGGSETADDMKMMPTTPVVFVPLTIRLAETEIVLPEPFRIDATFLGWYDNDEFNGDPVTLIPAGHAEDAILYAKWDETPIYTVTFDIGYEEGVVPAPQEVIQGFKVVKPADPARRAGYRFEGWFVNEVAYDFNAPVTEELVIVANWRAVTEYQITYKYHLDGVEDVVYWAEEAEVLVQPDDPVRANYRFLGWYVGDAEDPFDFTTQISETLILEAKWLDLVEFSITYELNGGTLVESYTERDVMVEAFLEDWYNWLVLIERINPAEVSLQVFTHGEGKTSGFNGTYGLAAGENSFFDTLYVLGADQRIVKPETGKYLNTVEGNRWFPLIDLLEQYVINVNNTQLLYNGYDIGRARIAGFFRKDINYMLTDPNHPLFSAIPIEYTPPTYTYNEDTPTFNLPLPILEGSEFGGWYDNAEFTGTPLNKIEKGTTGNLTLYAQFGVLREINFDVAYDDKPLITFEVSEGLGVVVPTVDVRPFHDLLGWAIEGTTDLIDFETYKVSGAVTFVAQWEELDKYTVTFDSAGGTEVAAVEVGEGRKVAVPPQPTNETLAFLGWYLGEDLYDFDAPVVADVTLVAKWENTLTYDVKEGRLSAADMAKYVDGIHMVATRYSSVGDATGTPIMVGHASTGAYWHTMAFEEVADGVYALLGKGTGYKHDDADLVIGYHDAVAGPYASALKSLYGIIPVGYLVVIPELPAEYAAVTHVDMYFMPAGSEKTIVSVSRNQSEVLLTPIRDGYNFVSWHTDEALESDAYVMPEEIPAGITLYPKWVEKAFIKVTLDVDGVTTEHDVENGQLFAKPTDPVKEGYVFLGWLLNEVEYDFATPVTENITLVADFRELYNYNVTFEKVEDEVDPSVVVVVEGNKVAEPDVPLREGYLFVEWQLDGVKFDFDTIITADIKLVAAWELTDTVVVTFDLNYPEAPTMEPVTIAKDAAVTKPADPEREGFIFEGWFVPEAEEAYDFATLVEENLTLEARWFEILEYTITYELDGGAFLGDYANKDEMLDAFLDDFYAYLGLTSDIVEFKHGAGKTSGWAGTWHSVAANKNKLYTAGRPTGVNEAFFISSAAYMEKWLPLFDHVELYTVTVNAGQSFWGSTWTGLVRIDEYVRGTRPTTEEQIGLPAAYSVPHAYKNIDGEIELVVPVKQYHAFLGWFDNAEGTGEAITVIGAEETGNKVLYAIWDELDAYTVSFDVNPDAVADLDEIANPADQTVYDGFKANNPNVVSIEGYDFLGWYLDDALFSFNTPITGSITLVAKWNALELFTVTFDGGYEGAEAIDPVEVYEGKVVAQPAAIVREGYDFSGWFLEDAETAFVFTTPITANITLTAHWEAINQLRVRNNAFGELEVSSSPYETNHFLLRDVFIADWNAFAGTSWTELVGSTFHASAKVGLTDTIGTNKDLSESNIYKFFNDPVYGAKWMWFLDYMKPHGAGIVHGERQIVAIQGDGTNSDYVLYHADQLSYSIVNFFNQSHVVGGYTAVNFLANFTPDQLWRYSTVKDFNDKVLANPENYTYYAVGDTLVVPEAPVRTGYAFEHYLAGAEEVQPGDYTLTADNVVFKPIYNAIDYDVKFYHGEEEVADLATTYNIEGALTLPLLVKEGFVFEGWYDNPEFTGTAVTTIAAGQTGARNFYAKATESANVQVEVTYVLNEGMLNAEETVENQTHYTEFLATRYLSAGSGTELALHTTSGGGFWYTVGLKATTISGVYTVLGKGTGYQNDEADLFITFHDSYVNASYGTKQEMVNRYNSVTVGSIVVVPNLPSEAATGIELEIFIYTPEAVKVDVEVTMQAPEALLVPVREGYTFEGWYDNAEFTGDAITEFPGYTAADEVTEVTYYAKWAEEAIE